MLICYEEVKEDEDNSFDVYLEHIFAIMKNWALLGDAATYYALLFENHKFMADFALSQDEYHSDYTFNNLKFENPEKKETINYYLGLSRSYTRVEKTKFDKMIMDNNDISWAFDQAVIALNTYVWVLDVKGRDPHPSKKDIIKEKNLKWDCLLVDHKFLDQMITHILLSLDYRPDPINPKPDHSLSLFLFACHGE